MDVCNLVFHQYHLILKIKPDVYAKVSFGRTYLMHGISPKICFYPVRLFWKVLLLDHPLRERRIYHLDISVRSISVKSILISDTDISKHEYEAVKNVLSQNWE